jgi:HSP20 family protein
MSTAFGLAPLRSREPELFRNLNRLSRLFGEPFGPFSVPFEDNLATRGWFPTCDVYETDAELVMKMDVPEVKKEDIKVNMDGNILTIKGERKFEKDVKEENYHRVERSYGEFTRSFTLPPTVNPNTTFAECKDGVLKITLKKREEAKAKTVEVNVK